MKIALEYRTPCCEHHNNVLTVVTEMNPKLNHNKILRELKKLLRCNGCIIKEEDGSIMMKLGGDRTKAVEEFFIKNGL